MKLSIVIAFIAVYAIVLFAHPLGELAHSQFHESRSEAHHHHHHDGQGAHVHHSHTPLIDAVMALAGTSAATPATEDDRSLRFWSDWSATALASLSVALGAALLLATTALVPTQRAAYPPTPPPRLLPS